jgi:phosphatidylserine/phosphatidylglycerophosphate/cardiolipin synthase-like enzyme
MCLMMTAAAGGAAGAVPPDPAELVTTIGHTRWIEGNDLRLLVGPVEAWQARLDLIGRARHHVMMSAFSWHNDPFGRAFAERLGAFVRDARSVNPEFEAWCLIDATAMGFFNKLGKTFKPIREAGAELRAYNPALGTATPIYDGRLHDKMLIADGRWAIVSGRNISEEYFDPKWWWFDLGVEIEGPAVADLQTHFLRAWTVAEDLARPSRFLWPEEKIMERVRTLWEEDRFPGGRCPLERYQNERYFPVLEDRPGGTRVAVLYDNSLVRRRAATTELVIALVQAARQEVDLMTPFPNFVEELTVALEEAVERGVEVRLFVNGAGAAIRSGPFYLAGLPTVIRLVEAGASVWAWSGDADVKERIVDAGCEPPHLPPLAVHGKLVRIDGELTIVHSSNFNIRSTFYNTEAGVAVLDRDFNHRAKEVLDELVALRDVELSCETGDNGITVERVMQKLTTEDVPGLRRALGRKQGFLDSMAVVW